MDGINENLPLVLNLKLTIDNNYYKSKQNIVRVAAIILLFYREMFLARLCESS